MNNTQITNSINAINQELAERDAGMDLAELLDIRQRDIAGELEWASTHNGICCFKVPSGSEISVPAAVVKHLA